jgi:hypothetical protein
VPFLISFPATRYMEILDESRMRVLRRSRGMRLCIRTSMYTTVIVHEPIAQKAHDYFPRHGQNQIGTGWKSAGSSEHIDGVFSPLRSSSSSEKLETPQYHATESSPGLRGEKVWVRSPK